jgi:hypothetical protein
LTLKSAGGVSVTSSVIARPGRDPDLRGVDDLGVREGRHPGRRGSGAWISCSARVRVLRVFRSTARIAWLFVSATYRVEPATLRPPGSSKVGRESESPASFVPTSVRTVRAFGSQTLILLLYVSAM